MSLGFYCYTVILIISFLLEGSESSIPVPTVRNFRISQIHTHTHTDILEQAAQLEFQEMEIGSLISFNMATAAQTQGCAYPNVAPPNASVFLDKLSSEQLDTDSWCEVIDSFGGKYATLVRVTYSYHKKKKHTPILI